MWNGAGFAESNFDAFENNFWNSVVHKKPTRGTARAYGSSD